MDWVGTLFVLVVLAVVVGLVLERRRRRSRVGGPSHAGAHRSLGADRGTPQGDTRPVDQRFAGFGDG